MVAPDLQIEDGKGTILISSEEGETDGEEQQGRRCPPPVRPPAGRESRGVLEGP